MTTLTTMPPAPEKELAPAAAQSATLSFPSVISEPARMQLLRMFRDPNVMEREDRAELVQQLKEAVALEPQVSELRVLLGMAFCVNYDGQAALEELRVACRLAPESFIAQLKLGELMMRLRICDQAAEHTKLAADLATTSLQAEMARRQASTIRTMQREGIERGGYGKLSNLFRLPRGLFSRKGEEKNAAAVGA